MSLLMSYLCGAVELRILQRDARDKVRWAAEPVDPGEQTKAQVYRAFQELRTLPHGLVKDAWYEQIGPYQYPSVHNAWLELATRRAEHLETPWALYVNERPIEPITRAQANLALVIAQLRKVG
jgi:hypothetical protein